MTDMNNNNTKINNIKTISDRGDSDMKFSFSNPASPPAQTVFSQQQSSNGNQRGTPKQYSSSTKIDQAAAKQQNAQSQFSKHKGAVQQTSGAMKKQGNSTPMGGGRMKRFSAYEASDDESVLEFQNMESQLVGADNGQKKSQMSNQQDAAHPLVHSQNNSSHTHSASKFKKKTSTMRMNNNNVNGGAKGNTVSSEAARKQQANLKQKASAKGIVKEEFQYVAPQPQNQPINDPTKKDQKAKQSTVKGGCCGIFCCGFCCSRGAGISEKDKNQEVDLRPEQRQPIEELQDTQLPQKNHNQQQNKVGNQNHLYNDQDLSLIDDNEEQDYQSISQSQISDIQNNKNHGSADFNMNNKNNKKVMNINDNDDLASHDDNFRFDGDDKEDDEPIDLENEEQLLATDSNRGVVDNATSKKVQIQDRSSKQQQQQVVGLDKEVAGGVDVDDMGDDERIELDLRSEANKNVNSGEQSYKNSIHQKSFKSNSDQMEMKQLNHDYDDGPDVIEEEDLAAQGQSNNTSYDKLQNEVVSSGFTNDLLVQNNYRSSPDGNRNYGKDNGDNFMHADSHANGGGLSPESMINLASDADQNSDKSSARMNQSNNGGAGRDSNNQQHERVPSENSSSHNNQRRHHMIAGDQMDCDDLIAMENEADEHDSLKEIEDDSDKTIDNDQEQYKMAQAKRMYVIHEVDEDAFSERSSRQLLGQSAHKHQQMYKDDQSIQDSHHNNNLLNSLQALKEENEGLDEDVYGLNNNQKHHQTLSIGDNDLSNMQINASQDIEPHNISSNIPARPSNEMLNNQYYQNNSNTGSGNFTPYGMSNNNGKQGNGGAQDAIRIEGDQSSGDEKMIQQQFSRTWEKDELHINPNKNNNDGIETIHIPQNTDQSPSNTGTGKQSKSLLNFVQYMEDEEAKQGQSPKKTIPQDDKLTPSPNQTSLQQQKTPIKKVDEKQNSFFRPQQKQNTKSAGAPTIPSNKQSSDSNIQLIQEEIILIDEFTSSGANNNSNDAGVSKFNNKEQPQNNQVFNYNNGQQQQQQPQIIVQKLAVDKSKLSQTYYSNFDQFVIANNLNLDDPTKRAAIKSGISDLEDGFESAAIFEKFKQGGNNGSTANLRKGSNASSKSSTKGGPNNNIQDTKEQAMQKMKQRTSVIEQQKMKQVQQAKEKALKLDRDRLAKQQCALKIQKVWKGHQQRVEFVELRDNLHKVKGIRRLFEKSYSNFRESIIGGLTKGLKDSKDNKDKVESQMMNDFLNICALQIQSNWRGHMYRKQNLPSLKTERKAEERFRAFIRAWKVRKVMQTREVFAMSQYIKDLGKVQEYFLYIEKADNVMLLNQLKKDRKKAIIGYIDTIEHLYSSGQWVKSYIGNKIVENESQFDSTDDGNGEFSHMKSPIKDFNMGDDEGQLKELVTTEKFLYDVDLERNPYIFESDEFIRQKFLEKRYKEYNGVDIEFVDQKKDSGKNLKSAKNSRNKLKAVDDDSSRFESDSAHFASKDKKSAVNKKGGKNDTEHVKRGVNPKDNVALPKNKMTFEQMLESAMENEKGGSSQGSKKVKNSGSKQFLKKKERYDPMKSLNDKKSSISEKNIEKKRIFKSKNRGNNLSDSEDENNSQAYDQDIYSDSNQTESKGTFKHIPRKSFIQLESEPLTANKTKLPPSLLQKLYVEQLKAQKYLRTDTGRPVGSNATPYQPLNKNQVYPAMNIPQDQMQLTMQLEQLEKVYQVYHGTGLEANQFFKSKTIQRDPPKNTLIPVIKEKSLFIKCNDDSVYESVLSELKMNYEKDTKVKRKWMFGSHGSY